MKIISDTFETAGFTAERHVTLRKELNEPFPNFHAMGWHHDTINKASLTLTGYKKLYRYIQQTKKGFTRLPKDRRRAIILSHLGNIEFCENGIIFYTTKQIQTGKTSYVKSEVIDKKLILFMGQDLKDRWQQIEARQFRKPYSWDPDEGILGFPNQKQGRSQVYYDGYGV